MLTTFESLMRLSHSSVASHWLFRKVPSHFIYLLLALGAIPCTFAAAMIKLPADLRLMRCAHCASITTRELASRYASCFRSFVAALFPAHVQASKYFVACSPAVAPAPFVCR
jgi:hypothetical protein